MDLEEATIKALIEAYSYNDNNEKIKLYLTNDVDGLEEYYLKDDMGNVYCIDALGNLYTASFDYGEPINLLDKSKYDLSEVPVKSPYATDYALLDRMVSDCKYFLGNGNGYEGNLYGGSVDKIVAKMKELWNKFPDEEKPEWLSMEDIENYEKEMKAKLTNK